MTAGAAKAWTTDADGQKLHCPVDNYLQEACYWDAWSGIRAQNWHRPLSAYMQALLQAGLQLVFFDEPQPLAGAPGVANRYRRIPWFVIMDWRRPV